MPDHDPFLAIWTRQPAEPFTLTLADIHARATRFQSRVRMRNITEYVAAGLVIAMFAWLGWLIPDPVIKTGAGLIVAGALYVCWKLHSLGRAAEVAASDHASSLADFHRAELMRQRAALATVWRWYLAPFLPGMLVFLGAVTLVADTGLPLEARLRTFVFGVGLMAAVFAAIGWLNARSVKALDAEIAEIDRVRTAGGES